MNVTTLEEERAELMALKETLQKYVRQLEQSNDDLERGKRYVWNGQVSKRVNCFYSLRVIMSSLEDFETKLNQVRLCSLLYLTFNLGVLLRLLKGMRCWKMS